MRSSPRSYARFTEQASGANRRLFEESGCLERLLGFITVPLQRLTSHRPVPGMPPRLTSSCLTSPRLTYPCPDAQLPDNFSKGDAKLLTGACALLGRRTS